MVVRLTKSQYEENAARDNRNRQQERLLREYRYTEAIKAVDKDTGHAIMAINKTIQKYALTQAEYNTLIELKTKAKKKPSKTLNIDIFKTVKTIKRNHY